MLGLSKTEVGASDWLWGARENTIVPPREGRAELMLWPHPFKRSDTAIKVAPASERFVSARNSVLGRVRGSLASADEAASLSLAVARTDPGRRARDRRRRGVRGGPRAVRRRRPARGGRSRRARGGAGEEQRRPCHRLRRRDPQLHRRPSSGRRE